MAGLGEEFRAAREARRLSLSDVSEQIHIRTVYLQSLEAEDWAAIAAPVYVRGFIRTYARFLGLNGETAVAAFNESVGTHARAEEYATTTTLRSRRGPSPWLWVAAAVAVGLVAFVGYSWYQYQQQGGVPVAVTSAPPAAPAAPAAAKADPSAPPPTAAAPKKAKPAGAPTLQVRVTQASWLLVKIDGAQALEGIFPPGTTKEFHGKRAMIRAGNAGGVDLTVNGRALGTMGQSGAVVDRTIALEE